MSNHSCRFLLALAAVFATNAADEKSDPWQPVRFFIGHWTGTAEGEAGNGTVDRTCELILSGHFIQEHNILSPISAALKKIEASSVG